MVSGNAFSEKSRSSGSSMKPRGDAGVVIPGLRKYKPAQIPRPQSAAMGMVAARGREGWMPPPMGWLQGRMHSAHGEGDKALEGFVPGTVHSITVEQIWRAFSSGAKNGKLRPLTRRELEEAFKEKNRVILDPSLLDAIFDSVHPDTGELRHPAGLLTYNLFMFEMQLQMPYGGTDDQSWVHKANDDIAECISRQRERKQKVNDKIKLIRMEKELEYQRVRKEEKDLNIRRPMRRMAVRANYH
mmetsp:Transcript_35898/g.49820  ORF Transcript_35898/g.49820 Transcript_35898/m.49820 type:complete len:243 (+) Transcript_35898:194-922(+)|eukprot:CAMPEP_0196587056 /NCGR_PEP_ID=MMETSP1081-20130531/56306_1 /TAXON_ID=36882 /ORGANISM="Pyramimonas amylifera, Strain CCMP720" /LENGTH=242 /DNA_ID=CAMNT_0041909131 /DNA_START=183 /DNA_END=911 /DNA_ORIENTATION=+